MLEKLTVHSRVSWSLAAIVAMASAAVVLPAYADAPAMRPATAPTAEQIAIAAKKKDLVAQYSAVFKKELVLIGDGSVLRDASKHADLRAQLLDLNGQMDQLSQQVKALSPPSTRPTATPTPEAQARYDAAHDIATESILIALGDSSTIDLAKGQAASLDSTIAHLGHFKLATGEWLSAPDDAARQEAADDIVGLAKTAADVNDDLFALAVTRVATSGIRGIGPTFFDKPLEAAILAEFPSKKFLVYVDQSERRERDQSLLDKLPNKPMVLAGTTVDGKPFSSEQLKGKVILVDFWATWCHPCRAELPHLKDVYKKYHDQGLEVVAISNDYSQGALTKYLAGDPDLVWPELFDAGASSDHLWHPLSVQFGVDSIPRMFLIDRNGVCRTVDARQNMDEMIPKLLAENASAAAN